MKAVEQISETRRKLKDVLLETTTTTVFTPEQEQEIKEALFYNQKEIIAKTVEELKNKFSNGKKRLKKFFINMLGRVKKIFSNVNESTIENIARTGEKVNRFINKWIMTPILAISLPLLIPILGFLAFMNAATFTAGVFSSALIMAVVWLICRAVCMVWADWINKHYYDKE